MLQKKYNESLKIIKDYKDRNEYLKCKLEKISHTKPSDSLQYDDNKQDNTETINSNCVEKKELKASSSKQSNLEEPTPSITSEMARVENYDDVIKSKKLCLNYKKT